MFSNFFRGKISDMGLIHIIVGAAVVVIAYIVIRRRCGLCAFTLPGDRCDRRRPNLEGYRDMYSKGGGNQTNCETACFSSEYYDACMNTCMQGGHADYEETGDEYDVLGVGQIDDLDRGFGYDTPGGYGYDYGLRGETPGR